MNKEKKNKTEQNQERNNNENRKKPPLYDYSRYLGLGFQLVAAVLIGFGIGHWLDQLIETQIPFLTIIFSLLAIIIALAQIIKEVTKQ